MMSFASGLASGSFGTLLLGLLAFVIGSSKLGNVEDSRTQILEDAGQLLAEHLGPLIKALDQHGIALMRHGRAIVGHGMTVTQHAATTAMQTGPDRRDAQAAAPAAPPAAPVIPAPTTTPENPA